MSIFSFPALPPDAIYRITSHFTFNFGIAFSELGSQTTKLHLDYIRGIAWQRRWFGEKKKAKSNVHEEIGLSPAVTTMEITQSIRGCLLHHCLWKQVVEKTQFKVFLIRSQDCVFPNTVYTENITVLGLS